MKKTYISPKTCVITTQLGEGLLADASNNAIAIDPNKTVTGNDDIGVKSSGPSYNVWSDDWSE